MKKLFVSLLISLFLGINVCGAENIIIPVREDFQMEEEGMEREMRKGRGRTDGEERIMEEPQIRERGDKRIDSLEREKTGIESLKEEVEMSNELDLKMEEQQIPIASPPQGDPFDLNSYQKKDIKRGEKVLFNAEVDEFSGAAVFSYPLSLPPGRANMVPELNIRYHSQNLEHENILGYGWNLNIPKITRSSRLGANEMYGLNEFILELENKSVKLVPITLVNGVNGIYGAEVEEDFLQVNYDLGNSWRIQTKKGLIYTFGENITERQESGTKTFKWMLTRVEDPLKNTIEYEYFKDLNQIYPKRIIYTNTKGQKDGNVEIRFQPFYKGPTANDIRGEKIVSFRPGFETETRYRISAVEAVVNGIYGNRPVKTWKLNYTADGNTVKRSILSSIQEEGVYFDPAISQYQVVTRPAATFTYQPRGAGWKVANYGVPIDFNTIRVQYADVNGDGLVDAMSDSTGLYLNEGNGKWKQSNYSLPNDFYQTGARYCHFGDINGDNFADLVIFGNQWSNSGVWLNDRETGFVFSSDWKLPTQTVNNPRYHLQDMNGDGLADIYHETGEIYFNNGKNGWAQKGTLSNAPTGQPQRNLYLFDVNGDGLTDVITGGHSSPTVFYLNTGETWLQKNISCPADFNGSWGLRIFDANGDGLADYANAPFPSGSDAVYLNNGFGFYSDPNFILPDLFGSYTNPLDGNGDFADDIGNAAKVYENQSGVSGLLKEVKTHLGGKISFEYTLSSYPSSGKYLNSKMGNRYLATKVIKDDGVGNKFVTTYEYKDAEMSVRTPFERNFGGFHEVIKTSPEGVVTKTYYHQGGGKDGYENGEFRDHFSKIGKPYLVEIWGEHSQYAGQRLFSRTVFTWNHDDLGNNRYFPYLWRETVTMLDGYPRGRSKTTEYKYGNYGNLIEKIDYGLVDASSQGMVMDIGSDLRKTVFNFALPNGSYLVYGLIFQESVYDQNNKKLRESRFYYDNQAFSRVTYGLLTKKESYNDFGGKYIAETYFYDRYGNPIKKINPKNYETRIVYDSFGYFPTKIINHLNQEIQLSFDEVTGEQKKVTGMNREIKEIFYDSLGRIHLIKSSPITGDKTQTVQIIGIEYGEMNVPVFIRETSPTLISSPAVVSNFSFYNGFGQIIQTRTYNKNGQYAVLNTKYFSNGGIAKTLFPYFESGTAYIVPNWANNGTSYVSDALSRVKEVITPLGTIKTHYAGDLKRVTDAEGKNKDFIYDIFGQLIKVKEYNKGETYETYYTYFPLGELKSVRNIYDDSRDFSYDSLGRLIAQTLFYAKGKSPRFYSYAYDDNGNITQILDPSGRKIDYSYDALDRITQEDFLDEAGVEVKYEYDGVYNQNAISKLTKVTLKNGVNFGYDYDNLGNLSQEHKFLNNQYFHTNYDYDILGRLTQITYPSLKKVSYTYAADLSLDKINYIEGASPIIFISRIEKEASGQLKRIDYGNGAFTTYVYEPAWNNLLKNIKTVSAGKTLQDLFYTYDKNANVKEIKEMGQNKTSRQAVYTYDDLSRLISMIAKDFSGKVVAGGTYEYDPLGNIRLISGRNQYYDQQRNGLPSSLTEIYEGSPAFKTIYLSYDNNGNLIQEGNKNFVYDYLNRLLEVKDGTTSLGKFFYDHAGNRYLKEQSSGKTWYINQNYEITPSGTVEYVFAFGKRIGSVFRASGKLPEISFRHEDHLASTALTTDISGNIVEEEDYLPYGESRMSVIASGKEKERYLFTGKEQDATGLYYFGARYYNPLIGRFITPDPLQLRLSGHLELLNDPQSLNDYAYARNNPLKYVDPNGMFWQGFWENVGTAIYNGTLWTGGVAYEVVNNQTYGLLQSIIGGSDHEWFRAGQDTGTTLSLGISAFETGLGVNMIDGGTAIGVVGCSSGAGCLVAAPAGVVTAAGGAALSSQGAASAAFALQQKAERMGGGKNNSLKDDLKPTLDRIKAGEKFPHVNDGVIHKNKDGLLPQKPYGYYREYVHPTNGEKGAGLQRVIMGKEGDIWYTPDHYKSFVPVK